MGPSRAFDDATLRFMTGDPAKAWTLEVRPDATAVQKARLSAFLAHSKAG